MFVPVIYLLFYKEFDVISESAKDFISCLLVREPNGRLSATECLQVSPILMLLNSHPLSLHVPELNVTDDPKFLCLSSSCSTLSNTNSLRYSRALGLWPIQALLESSIKFQVKTMKTIST